VVYPAYVQPKFDGHRCIAVLDGGEASLWSRTRKPITGLPHIISALEEWAHKMDVPDVVLDGECYNHDYRNKFEELTSFIRSPEAKPGHEVVQYHVYDCEAEGTFEERWEFLYRVLGWGPIVRVETTRVGDEDEVMLAMDKFLADGYEGCMVRNSAGLYVNKRSKDLLKVKEFQDAEFEVVAVEEGRGKLAGHAIFVCRTEAGTEFRAKMRGETAALKKYFDRPELAIGRQLTVKYQGITNKSKVPRFPVAERFAEPL